MGYLDAIIGPGIWLITDGTTLNFLIGLVIFGFAAVILTLLVLLVVI